MPPLSLPLPTPTPPPPPPAAAVAACYWCLLPPAPPKPSTPCCPASILSRSSMDVAGQQAGHLRLERRHANLAFSSWRLSSTLVQAQGSVALPAPVVPPQATDTDYVTARHAALLNGLTQQPCGCYLFLDGQQGAAGAAALQLCAVELGEGGKPPLLHRLAGEPVHWQLPRVSCCSEAGLHPLPACSALALPTCCHQTSMGSCLPFPAAKSLSICL